MQEKCPIKGEICVLLKMPQVTYDHVKPKKLNSSYSFIQLSDNVYTTILLSFYICFKNILEI
jgi:hypothetical protein